MGAGDAVLLSTAAWECGELIVFLWWFDMQSWKTKAVSHHTIITWMSATHSQSEMTKKYLPLSIKSKGHYKIIVHKCFFSILGHSVLAAGCWFSIFGKRLCRALLFLSVGDGVASATPELCYLLPISFCLRNWMLALLSASSGYCSTGRT